MKTLNKIILTSVIVLAMGIVVSGTGSISGAVNLLLNDAAKITLETPVINVSNYDTSLKLYANDHNIFGQDNGESIELHSVKNDSKSYLGWYAYDPASNSQKSVGWFGCHYDSDPVTTPPHQHCSLETLDDDGWVNTKFAVTYGSDQAINHANFYTVDVGFPVVGGATEPAIYWNERPDMGLWYDNSAKSTKFVSNGVSKLAISNTTVVLLNGTTVQSQPIDVIDGSSSAPAYTFSNNKTVGLWFDNSNKEVKIANGGSSRLSIGNGYVAVLNDLRIPTNKPSTPAAGSMFFNQTSKTTNCFDGSVWVYCGNGTAV